MRKQYMKGGTLFFIGYLLSPISLWDDVFVNIPISYILALIVKHFSPDAFLPSMILIYWLTNLLGFLCMRKGLGEMKSKKNEEDKTRALTKDILSSVAYTLVLVILVKFNVLQISF